MAQRDFCHTVTQNVTPAQKNQVIWDQNQSLDIAAGLWNCVSLTSAPLTLVLNDSQNPWERAQGNKPPSWTSPLNWTCPLSPWGKRLVGDFLFSASEDHINFVKRSLFKAWDLLTGSMHVPLVRWPAEMLSYGEGSLMVRKEPRIHLCNCMCCGHIIPFSVSEKVLHQFIVCFSFKQSFHKWLYGKARLKSHISCFGSH